MQSIGHIYYKLRRFGIIILLMNSVLFFSTLIGALSGQPRQDNILPWRQDVSPLYERLFHYMAWPKEQKFGVLEERRDIPYSFEILITHVFKDGVLEKNWEKKILRVKDWIPKSVHGISRDAYLFRQNFKDGTLHLCDTRGDLLIAFTPGKDDSLLKDPRKSLNNIIGELFKLRFPDDPNKVPLKQDKKTGMFLGSVGYGHRPGVTSTSIDKEKPAFDLLCIVGEKVVIFEFQKGYIPGCVIDIRYPIFGETPPEFELINTALENLREFEEPTAEDIPELIKLLSSMPEGPTLAQYKENPYLHLKISEAKCGALRLIKASIESIETGGNTEVELIRQALNVEQYIQEPYENPPKSILFSIKSAAVDALYRIRTDEAAMLHFEIINREKDPSDRRSLLGELGKYKIFRSRLEKMYERAKAKGRHITRYEMYEKLREEISRESPVSSDVTEGRASVEETPFQEKGTTILMLSITLVIALFTFGGIFVLLKKKKLLSRNK